MKKKYVFGLMMVSLLSAGAMAEEAPAAAESKGPEVAFSGEVEFDAYTGDLFSDGAKTHSYASTFDFNVGVKFNDQWSAEVQLEADGETTDPAAVYNGAFIQYTKSENFVVKAGDLTFSEGAFLNYYGYDDPADNAAGMAEHDIRGVEVDFNGFIFGLGFGRGDNDNQVCVEEDGEETCVGVAYDAHLAYELGLGEHTLRPYVDYKSYQEPKHNELHAGLDANLKFGGFGLHAVYGLHADALGEDEPGATHAFLLEPSFEVGGFNIKATVFYALFDEDAPIDHGEEIPEYMLAYVEPSLNLVGSLTLGIPLEYHTNSTDENTDLESFAAGARLYFAPVEGLEMTGFAMFNVPLGDDYGDDDDVSLTLGVETVFSF
ncbi:hypothetical protein [Fibrobacter sp. UWEL]|uniref:hypothetical protein n=1 Tax=Fibrobacter sp. UWEL TaxID=1896209 RepID=UPI000911B15D|nr:hypothetical protein [Fibrobacter sp. UWEL]SHK63596.1 hypothetical protein SAMN05720468_104124 [Fibrobacter sp. UWEL]